MNLLLKLETSTPLFLKCTDPADRKSLRHSWFQKVENKVCYKNEDTCMNEDILKNVIAFVITFGGDTFIIFNFI